MTSRLSYALHLVTLVLLQAVLDAVEQQAQYSVREFAARNYVSPAAVIRLSKKLGYTGYTDMIYRLGFLVRNGDRNKAHTSDINSFIGEIPPSRIEAFLDRLDREGFRTIVPLYAAWREALPGIQAEYEEYEAKNFVAKGLVLLKRGGKRRNRRGRI